jgi:hypothetical protein
METKGSLPCLQGPAFQRIHSSVTCRNKLVLYGEGVVSSSPNPKAGEPLLVGSPIASFNEIRRVYSEMKHAYRWTCIHCHIPTTVDTISKVSCLW